MTVVSWFHFHSGFCVKAHQLTNNEKFFVNVCHSDSIPMPEDISVQQLTEILQSETPSHYKVPMSITELRTTPDKSGKDSMVCDVAIHPAFFHKIEMSMPFRDFLMTIVFEALDSKYKVKINRDTWMILKNRKCMGSLIKHRIQNRDVRQVIESYQNPTKEQKTRLNELQQGQRGSKIFVEDITPGLEQEANKNSTAPRTVLSPSSTVDTNADNKTNGDSSDEVSSAKGIVIPTTANGTKNNSKTRIPEHILFKHKTNNDQIQLVAEFHLPDIISASEFVLDMNRERLVLEARRANYMFDAFLPYAINTNGTIARFDKVQRVSVTERFPGEFGEQ